MVKASIEAIDIDPKTGSTLGFYTFGDDRPNILILSAMDGVSATCVYSGYLLMKQLEDIHRIDGTIQFLPVANPLAFRLGLPISPLDSKDLDSVFPGNEQGTVTERIAWEIWRKASQADFIIHLKTTAQKCVSHVAGMHREYIHVRNLASQISLPLVVQSSGRRGSLITEAAHEGIPAVRIEMRGELNGVDTQAAVEVREAIMNLLKIKDMISGERIDSSATHTSRCQSINVEEEGFFTPIARLGEFVDAGSVIGRIQDTIDVITPQSGALISLSQMKYVFEGDMIARVAPPIGSSTSPSTNEDDMTRRKW
jgi:predicted deacylase